MKREAAPTIEQIAEVIKHIDLARLNNRLVGKSLLDFEHCLIEVLGELVESHRIHLDIVARLAKDCIETNSRSEFLSAYSEYTKEKSVHNQRYANYSPVGRYFHRLYQRLTDFEDKQINDKKTVTVTHARILVAIINNHLELMTRDSQYQNSKIDKLWDHWISHD